ncbi:hypothetical protein [Sulfuricella sp.]|nr:hypothetical protein [Sulfuricella sp.]HUX64931.1 hypothetical protein [Sulfuricella sp.]
MIVNKTLGTGILQPLTGWMVDRATQARGGVAALHQLSDYQAGLGEWVF